MESSGLVDSRWFERLLRELEFELWIGDPAKLIRDVCRRRLQLEHPKLDEAASLGRDLEKTCYVGISLFQTPAGDDFRVELEMSSRR
jgi:hypothetical protein